MKHLEVDGPEEVVYRGAIFEVIKRPMNINGKKMIFEIARRSPGVRLIIVKKNQLLITKEFRSELGRYDHRLPGGKVFDTLGEYERHRSQDMVPFALEAAKRECKEETGLIANSIKHFITTQAGATFVWDLLYFIIDEFENSESGQELEAAEIITTEWKSFEEVKKMCTEGDISEDRTIGVLFKFLSHYSGNTLVDKAVKNT